MSLKIEQLTGLEPDCQSFIANQVENYTNGNLGEKPQMLPINTQAVYGKYISFVALKLGEFAGYISASQPEFFQGASMPEVGSLWVPRLYREQGIAHKLITVITGHLVSAGHLPYAFCNPRSKPIFQDLGYVLADPQQIPNAAFRLCKDCPAAPFKGCCDKTLIYEGDAK